MTKTKGRREKKKEYKEARKRKQANVNVEGETVGAIDHGLLVLLGVEKDDDNAKMEKLAHKVMNYRVFGDENGKMNLNVQQVNGSLLVVSQFTLAADTSRGLRPSFAEKGASPDKALANLHIRGKLTRCHFNSFIFTMFNKGLI